MQIYDKINLAFFRNIGAISPQSSFIENKNRLMENNNSSMNINNSIPQIDDGNAKDKEKDKNNSINKGSLNLNVSNINEVSANANEENKSVLMQNSEIINNNIINRPELFTIAEKVGKYLYKQKIMGYVTIELIVFKTNFNYQQSTGKNVDYGQEYWAIDLKFGLTDISSSINFCSFLYNHYYDKMNPDINLFNISLTKEKVLANDKCKIFSFPFLSHPRISEIKMKDLVKSFKLENLINDVWKKKGTIFNVIVVLVCGKW